MKNEEFKNEFMQTFGFYPETGIDKILKEIREQKENNRNSLRKEAQFSKAAQTLIRQHLPKTIYKLAKLCPKGWDKNIWYEMCRRPYMDRCSVAAALLVLEIDRLEFEKIKSNNEDLPFTFDRSIVDIITKEVIQPLNDSKAIKITKDEKGNFKVEKI